MRWIHYHLGVKWMFATLINAVVISGIAFVLIKIKIIPWEIWILFASIGIFGLIEIILFWHLCTKPIHGVIHEMKAVITGKSFQKIFTKRIDEIGILAHFFNTITNSIARVSGNLEEHRRMESELEIARKIQHTILPPKNPHIPGLEITAKTKPAAEIGGDSFNFFSTPENTFIYIGDVTGHGVPSGLVMMMVDTLLQTFTDTEKTAFDVMVKTNKYLKPRLNATMFMTMVMLRFDHSTQTLSYLGAGHEHIIHYHAATGKVDAIRSGGIALGMLPDMAKVVKEVTLDFQPDDLIILYSDGFLDAKNMKGERFGLEKLVKMVETVGNKMNTDDLFDQLAVELTSYMENSIQEDDITLMVIKRLPKGATQSTGTENGTSTEWTGENAQKKV